MRACPPSNTPLERTFLLLPSILRAPQALLEIPRHEIGIVDTYRAQIGQYLASEDRTALLASGFRRAGGSLQRGIVYLREADGCRVIEYQTCTAIEVSLPRLFGLSNHSQDLLSSYMTAQGVT